MSTLVDYRTSISVDYRIATFLDELKYDSAFYLKLDDLFSNGYATKINLPEVIKTNLKVDLFFLDIENLKKNSVIEIKRNLHYRQSYLVFDEKANPKNTISVQLLNQLKPFKIISKSELDTDFINGELLALDEANQKFALQKLSQELSQQEELLKSDLEDKIQSEQIELINRRQKILETNKRTESLRKILFSLSSETDIARAETILNELIPQSTSAIWVKIIPKALCGNFEKDLATQLPNSFIKKDGTGYNLYFIKNDKKNFKLADQEMFIKVSDALNFNISKMESLQYEQKLEKIVSQAFNSTHYPLLIVDRNYNIIESNKAFHRYPQAKSKCYAVMFNLNAPCENCKFGQNFQLEHKQDQDLDPSHGHYYYSVQSQKLLDIDEKNSHWVHFYSDITEEKILQQRISQTAKMKELGLISSSIAHELNNPLGGIISYLQVLQMELPKTHGLQAELKDMVAASDRMKKIIQNLLVFSRKPVIFEKTSEKIFDLVQDSISLNELSFKLENIKVVVSPDPIFESEKIIVSKSAFRDSINLIFSYFIDGLKRKRMLKNNLPGLIEVKFSQDQMSFNLELQSNIGPLNSDLKTKNIYFLIIHKSVTDQNLQIELTEPNSLWVGVRVIIPKSGNAV